MKKLAIKSLFPVLLALLFLGMPACTLDDIDNPNAPDQTALENGGASINDLRLLASGLESVMRVDMEFQYWTTSIVGREYWDLRNTDPRYTGELLGAGGSPLDPNGFLTTRAYARAYRIVRNAWVMIHATQNTSAALTPAQRNALLGHARTLLAFGLLSELNRQYQNGIRVDVENPDQLGPFVGYADALRAIADILEAAHTELSNGGTDFLFTSTLGNVSRVRQFNRAIAARVALYRNDKGLVRSHLGQTWMDADGDMDEGVYFSFGAGGNNILNPLFVVPDQTKYVVHPATVDDAEFGDNRFTSKTRLLAAPFAADGLSGDVQVQLVASNTSAFPIIRNEELVLMWAEANIGSNNGAAVTAINKVRAAAGLAAYNGPTDDASLENQVLHERRYSLFGEGHRWIDMRRYNRLSQIPTDRPGDIVHTQFPRPILEQ
ncbi:MAG: RagB/SusD family nutrient uptake outer membrane protein [Saprospiraceae bacterium]|nr:RagB/SusD family nutrient uptake outer membrane protein [Saprospiraceae bacterium]